jgi:exodeoxyribonuclease V alpha subunit
MQTPVVLENLSGLVERVTYHNEDNGFCVLRVKVRGRQDLVTVVGCSSCISAGEFVHASGEWVNDCQHGLQFKAKFLKVTLPTTLEGIEKYLSSGLIKGIGPVYGKKLVDCFGEDVFEIIEQQPERLKEVSGIGFLRSQKIINGWAEQKAVRDIMLFLHSHGVSTSKAARIYKIYGCESISIITENPYCLAKDIRGIGFVSADKIAQKVGIEKTSLIRARAGISYALTTALDDGHCGLPKTQLLELCQKLLEMDLNLVEQALGLELENEEVLEENIEETACVFLKKLALAESNIAKRLIALSKGKLPWPSIEPGLAINWVQEKTKLMLSDSQKKAIEKALNSKVLIITGGPGVGKTTLVNSILKILKTRKINIALSAPTGRAAKRLRDNYRI